MPAEKQGTETNQSDHLLISGTGRAGTTFLVRYLAGMGLETHLDLHGEAQWFEDANAGFEDPPIPLPGTRLPYVVKSPWLCEMVDSVLNNPSIRLDAVIVPVRDLVEAVASRVVLEKQAIYRKTSESGFNQDWETWGQTPGGIVFSLNPIDQGRLLAVWFHRLIERLTEADIPIVLLNFPRLAEDSDYLFHKLRTFLPKTATLGQARLLHERTADATKIRVGQELRTKRSAEQLQADSLGVAYPSQAQLGQIALNREVIRLKNALSQTQTGLEAAKQEYAKLAAQLAEKTSEVSSLNTQLAQQLNWVSDVERVRAEMRALTAQRDALLSSRSWRLTSPFRTLVRMVREYSSR
jgi:hypothetical protein